MIGGTSLAGGEGKIFGTLIGAFIIAVIKNGMNLTNVESYTQKVVLGLVILGAVLLLWLISIVIRDASIIDIFWGLGFVVMACKRDDRIARLLSLPADHKIFGGLGMGYPRLSFDKWPERKPARVTWL